MGVWAGRVPLVKAALGTLKWSRRVWVSERREVGEDVVSGECGAIWVVTGGTGLSEE